MSNIANEMVWAEERSTVTQAARTAIKKAKKIECENIKKGWRWIKVGTRTQILVPCDKDGKPTQDGLQRIQRLKKNLCI